MTLTSHQLILLPFCHLFLDLFYRIKRYGSIGSLSPLLDFMCCKESKGVFRLWIDLLHTESYPKHKNTTTMSWHSIRKVNNHFTKLWDATQFSKNKSPFPRYLRLQSHHASAFESWRLLTQYDKRCFRAICAWTFPFPYLIITNSDIIHHFI